MGSGFLVRTEIQNIRRALSGGAVIHRRLFPPDIGVAPVAGVTGSIGTVGDSLDHALMESTIRLLKTELIDTDRTTWTGRADVERDTASSVCWL
jgi:transposase InsO family protein